MTTTRTVTNPLTGKRFRTSSNRRFALLSNLGGGEVEKRSDKTAPLFAEARRVGASREVGTDTFVKRMSWTNRRTGEAVEFERRFVVVDTTTDEVVAVDA